MLRGHSQENDPQELFLHKQSWGTLPENKSELSSGIQHMSYKSACKKDRIITKSIINHIIHFDLCWIWRRNKDQPNKPEYPRVLLSHHLASRMWFRYTCSTLTLNISSRSINHHKPDYVKGKSAELIKATIESLLIFLIFRTCVMVICWLVEKKVLYIE